MKSLSSLILAIAAAISVQSLSYGQTGQKSAGGITQGTLSFTVKTISNGTGYSPKHVLSIWVKDSLGNFVISRKVMANTRKKHLVKWVASSAYNTTSATTGATLSSHQSHSITWDGKDANGNDVPDGEYQVWVEYTSVNSANGQPAGPSTSVSFRKGPVNDHQAPANQTYFQDMVLDWIPLGAGISSVLPSEYNLVAYPNPFTDKVTFRMTLPIRSQVQATVISSSGDTVASLVEDSAGKGEYIFSWDGSTPDGRKAGPGLYILQLKINGRTFHERILKF